MATGVVMPYSTYLSRHGVEQYDCKLYSDLFIVALASSAERSPAHLKNVLEFTVQTINNTYRCKSGPYSCFVGDSETPQVYDEYSLAYSTPCATTTAQISELGSHGRLDTARTTSYSNLQQRHYQYSTYTG